MPKAVEFHGWRFRAEPELTRSAYSASGTQGAQECSCAYCRNLVALRGIEYSSELRAFLESVGIDPHKEAEVWEAGPLEDGYCFNAGWWHFIGEVETEGEPAIELRPAAGTRAREFTLVFLPGQASLKLASLPSAPLVQVEFSVKLPWVLDEPYPNG